jgi:hypothetical protein
MSSPPTREELLTMAFLGQENFTPAAEEQQAPRFLSLAPTTSASYPSTPAFKSPAPQSPTQAATDTPNNTMVDPTPARALTVSTAMPSAAVIDEALKTRRSSSLSSDGSNQKRRFLKLGPVHFGEGAGSGDWSEEVVDE